MTSLQAAKSLALEGIKKYELGERGEGGERYGIHHGEMGRNRAKRLKETLEAAQSEKEILTALLAVFTIEPKPSCFFSNPFRNIGRSSKLASLISDQFLSGTILHNGVLGSRYQRIESSVFTAEQCAAAEANMNNFNGSNASPVGRYDYFDKTKAVRNMLRDVLDTKFKADKNEIIKSASKLRTAFEKTDVKPAASKRFNLMHHFR